MTHHGIYKNFSMPVSMEKPTNISCIPASKMVSRPFPEDLRAALSAANTSPMNRDWGNIANCMYLFLPSVCLN